MGSYECKVPHYPHSVVRFSTLRMECEVELLADNDFSLVSAAQLVSRFKTTEGRGVGVDLPQLEYNVGREGMMYLAEANRRDHASHNSHGMLIKPKIGMRSKWGI